MNKYKAVFFVRFSPLTKYPNVTDVRYTSPEEDACIGQVTALKIKALKIFCYSYCKILIPLATMFFFNL